jgi:hypothetical protein
MVARPMSESTGNAVAEHDLSHDPERLAEKQPPGAGPRSSTNAPASRGGARTSAARSANSRVPPAARTASGTLDSRAGAMSEACEARAVPDNVMRTATPTPISTMML